MPVCDICNKDIRWEDGYVLTTRQVATSETYWEAALKGAWSATHAMDPEGDTLAMLVQQQAAQSSGWLVCESCSTSFAFDKQQAKAFSRAQNSNPSGAGPAPAEAVARAAANVWKRLYGSSPSSLQFSSSPPSRASAGFKASQAGKQSPSCFVATAVYCDAYCPEVSALQEFRDNVLMHSMAGRTFIRAYYRIGPCLAERIKRWPIGRRVVRRILDGFVSVLSRVLT